MAAITAFASGRINEVYRRPAETMSAERQGCVKTGVDRDVACQAVATTGLLKAGAAEQLKSLINNLRDGNVQLAGVANQIMSFINPVNYQARIDELLANQPKVLAKLERLEASEKSPQEKALGAFAILRNKAPGALAEITSELYREAGIPARQVEVMVNSMFKPEAREVAKAAINEIFADQTSGHKVFAANAANN